jgi:hypothetical protein
LHGPSLIVYSEDRCQQLVADLANSPDTLLFVKAGKPLECLLRALPPNLEFRPEGRQGGVLAGHVHRSFDRMFDAYAHHNP